MQTDEQLLVTFLSVCIVDSEHVFMSTGEISKFLIEFQHL